MSFSLYDKGDIVRREATLDSLIHKPALNKMRRGSQTQAASDKTVEGQSTSQGQSTFQKALAQRAYEENTQSNEKIKVIFAHQIMSSPVITLHKEASLLEAQSLFVERRFRHVPIVEMGRLVGILSDRDILAHINQGQASQIKDYMSHEVLTAAEETTIHDLARVMFEERIGALPILEKDTLSGIITRSDILRALVHRGPIELWV